MYRDETRVSQTSVTTSVARKELGITGRNGTAMDGLDGESSIFFRDSVRSNDARARDTTSTSSSSSSRRKRNRVNAAIVFAVANNNSAAIINRFACGDRDET